MHIVCYPMNGTNSHTNIVNSNLLPIGRQTFNPLVPNKYTPAAVIL